MEMARIASLYPGINELTKMAHEKGLQLDRIERISMTSSHERVIYQFTKGELRT
jgi:hypothetical protein